MVDSGIYQILNLSNKKRYIGSSKNISFRIKEHIRLLKSGKGVNRYLQHAWNKYGLEQFVFETLLICSENTLEFYEQLVIDEFDTKNRKVGYNIIDVNGFGKVSEDPKIRQILSKKRKQLWKNEEYRKKHLNKSGKDSFFYGRNQTEEWKKAQSIRMSGKNNPSYNKIHSKETRQKISKAISGEKNGMYGKTHTSEVRKRLSEFRRGSSWKQESKNKMSNTMKNKWADPNYRQMMLEARRK